MNLIVNKFSFFFFFFCVLSCVPKKHISENNHCIFYEKANVEVKDNGKKINLRVDILDYNSYLKILIQNEVGITLLNFKIFNDSVSVNGLLSDAISEEDIKGSSYYDFLKKELIKKILLDKCTITDQLFFFKYGINISFDSKDNLQFYDLKGSRILLLEYVKIVKRNGRTLPEEFKIYLQGREIYLKVTKLKFYK